MDDTNRAWEFVTGWIAGNSNHFIKAYDVMGLDGSPVDPDTASMSYTEKARASSGILSCLVFTIKSILSLTLLTMLD